MIRNLGQVAAIYIGSSQPTNTNLIWLDNTVVPYAFRAYDGSTWSELATRDWVKMFVDGWLVSLPPSTQAGDTDYLLINSNNVNYKITVKEFVKSAVGNPLDFKGVIRTDADFPNPANCEAGDMYVIITSPAGGTVTDPYSGQVFEDTEKIVWDEVTKSWASLGKIEINVDLSTDYSATNVTINSSAGKSTTIEAASTSLAGVMLPQQVKRLTYLSNGSTVPGDPSELDPDTPAHKHNYGDILDRLISQQETGDSTFHPMSQKATTDNLDLKFDKANVVQVQGAATDMVMSQKAVTDALKTLSDDFNNKLTNYLPLAGGTMKGSIGFPAESGIIGNADGTSDTYILRSFNNRLDIGAVALSTRIISNASDLLHHRLDTSYKIWDAYNLPTPASTTDLANYLPLAGGTLTGQAIFNSYGLAFNNNTWSNDLVPNRTFGGYLQVLDAYDASSAGGPTNYGTVLQVNSRNTHWANQLWFSGGAEASKNGLYYRHMAYNETTYGEWNRLLTNKDVNIIQTQSSSNPTTLPVNQIFYSEIQNVAETPTTKGLLFSVQGDDKGIQLWASSSKTELYYRTKWASFGNWIKLATTSDLGNYLPLTGGTLSGNLTINTVGSTALVINNNDTNGSETFMRVLRKGTASAAIGFRDSLGAYIYNYNSNKYLFIDNDGYARVGTASSSTRLALITDIPSVSGYLPLTGGTLTGTLSINSGGSEPLIINNSASAGEAYVVTKTQGTTRGVMGWNSSLGMFLQDNRGYTFSVKADGAYFGASSSTLTKLLTSADLSSYATQTWAKGQFAPLSRFNTSTGYTTIKVTGQEFNFDSTNSEIYMNYRTLSGSTAVTKIIWKAGGGANSTALCEGRWGNLYMNNNLVATQNWVTSQGYYKSGSSSPLFTSGVYLAANAGTTGGWARGYWVGNSSSTDATGVVFGGFGNGDTPNYAYIGVGSNLSYASVNNLKIYTDKVTFGNKTLATTDLIPSIPSITISNSGSGNAVTAITASGHTLIVTKGATYLTSSSLSGYATQSWVTSQGYLTSSSLSGYATQEWVNSQNFVKSTSTKKVTDIQVVDALPATQASGVLYLVVK